MSIIDRLARGLLNVGVDEEQEKELRACIRAADEARRELDEATYHGGDSVDVLIRQQAVEHANRVVDDVLDSHSVPFAVALMDDNTLVCMAHRRHKDNPAIIERLQSAGQLVAATLELMERTRATRADGEESNM